MRTRRLKGQGRFGNALLGLALALPVCITGCGGQPAQAGAAAQRAANAQNAAGEAPRIQIPERLSLAFFERSLEGKVQVAGSTEAPQTSDIDWVQGQPIGPEPGPGALADFRDRMNCTVFKDAGGGRVCFRVQGDVSSVALTANEIQADGFDSLKDMKLESAIRGEGSVDLIFSALSSDQAPVQVKLQLRQL